ncbi:MAG: T9SS type A sorting domain-containing protein [Bacteroidales bacterium]|nr:T9SS type A sorting domain-containing protein [Bacteroidales bacterium]
MKNLVQNKLVLSIAFGFISVFGFSQNQGVNSFKAGMSINHNQSGIVRGNTKCTLSTQSQTNLSVFQIEETYEKDAVYSNRIPEEELLKQKVQNSNNENSAQLKSGTRSTTIYSQDFEAFSPGLLGNTPVYGWYSTKQPNICGENYWGVYSTGVYSINNQSLKVTAFDASCNSYPSEYLITSSTDMYAYVTIDASGYESLNLNFNWICDGEIYSGTYYDYGRVYCRAGTSGTWNLLNFGGNDGLGKYAGQTTTQSESLNLPSSIENGIFQIAFRWVNDGSYGTYSGFVVDNIVVLGSSLGTPSTCTTPISPADGFGSHTPGDPLIWNAASGATSYDVYFGTSSNPPYVTNVATTSYSPTLADNTTYYWKIVPRNSSGTPTGCAVWEFTTGTGPVNGDYRTRYLTGPYAWNNASNWEVFNGSSWIVASVLPSATNNVHIRQNSQYVVLNNPMTSTGAPAACNNIRIDGTLQFWNGLDAVTDAWGDLSVYGNIEIMPTGIFETFVNVTGIEAVSAINMVNGGDITNYGTLSLYKETNSSSFTAAWICFYGGNTSNFTLASGSDTRLFYLQIAKDDPSDIVNFIVNEDFLAVNDEYGGNNGFLKSYSLNSWDETPTGQFVIGGTYTKNNPVWFMGLTTYSFAFNTSNGISSGLTVEIDNPNFGIMAQDVIFNLAGKLIVSQGQCDIGATSGTVGGVDQSQYYLNILNGGHLEVNGGALNTRAGIAGNGTHYFTMTDGFVNVGRNANASSRGLFDLQGSPQVNISGGKITLSDNRYVSNNLGYRVDDGTINITGGTLQIGTVNSPIGSNTFSIAGPTPSIELYTNGTTIASNAIMWDDVQCYGYLDIPEFCGLSIYDQDNGDTPHTFSITGNINHEGNLYAEVENSKILFNGSANQIFHTTGAYNDVLGEAGISIIEVDNPAGVQLTGSSTAVTKNFINTNGTFHIGDCSLGLSGIVTRTNGYFGGNSNSELYVTGNGTLGNLFFDPTANNLQILEIDRQNTGIVNLATDLNVHQSINFVNGTLYTYLDNNIVNGSNTIYLQSYAVLFNENTNSYIYGKVSLTEDLMSAREPGNIGAYFSDLSENLGSTTIVRMTGDEAEQSIADATSIDCYWDINVSSQPSSAVSMSFEWFGNFDNALSTTNMSVFSKDGVDPWEEIGSPVSVSGNPRTITADADHFSRWTVAVKDQVLPVSLLYFDVQCNGHSKEFSWATASETNSDYFVIMESQDNKNYKPIAKIEAAGNSNQTKEYSYAVEELLDDAYYRLKQVDFDGRDEEFSIIYSNCKNDLNADITVYPNPFNGEEVFINSSKIIKNAVVEIYDPAGRIVYKTELEQIRSDTQIRINNKLEPGAYILAVNTKNNFIQKFVIIAK